MSGAASHTQLIKMRASAEAVASLAGSNNAAKMQQVACSNNNNNHNSSSRNLSAIMEQLQVDYGKYKYTVYRCASKFVALQKIFHTSKIPYKLVLAILERHGMPASSGGNLNLMVPPFQLTSLLHDIYFACEKLGHFTKTSSYTLETATALLANFFWNIYDPQRRHSISLLEIRITFLLLCKLYSSEHMVGDFFGLLVESRSQSVSRFAFEQLLSTLSKMLSYLGEAKAYGGHNLPLMMEQCFARCPHNASGLGEQQFHGLWTTTQTRFLIYGNLLALIKRIEDTEHLIHSNPCAGCRLEHIIGIRFKCQVCRDLSLCLPCFAAGFVGGRHEASHRMCEVFVEDKPPQRWTRYLARLCGWIAHPQKAQRDGAEEEERRGFCNAQESANGGSLGQPSTAPELAPIPAETRSFRCNSTTKPPMIEQQQQAQPQQPQQELCSLTGLATTASQASNRMQSIIDRLQLQNAKLETQLQMVSTTSSAQISEFLSAHQSFLLQIIEDMRQLSRAASTTTSPSGPAAPLTSSTFLNSSTPQRQQAFVDMYAPVGANLTHSINGAELNRSYLEANKSDYSLNDISLWFDQRRSSAAAAAPLSLPLPLGALLEQHPVNGDGRDTEMANFKLLLHKVKEIVEDSYSDNAELSAATQNLENVLDSIIKTEEHQRRSST